MSSKMIEINPERKYAVLMETSGEECESWYYCILYNGNEENLLYLQSQIEPVKWRVDDGLSTFDLDLDHLISETTAKELTKLELNHCFFHRKFDGVLQKIDLGFKSGDKNKRKIKKAFEILGYGRIEDFIDGEDIDEEDLADPNEVQSSSDDCSDESSSDDSSDEDDEDDKDSSIEDFKRLKLSDGSKNTAEESRRSSRPSEKELESIRERQRSMRELESKRENEKLERESRREESRREVPASNRDESRRDESRRTESRREESRREESRRTESRRDESRRDESRRTESHRDESRRFDESSLPSTLRKKRN